MKHRYLRSIIPAIVQAIVVAIVLLPGVSAHADPVEELVTFSAGTTARADEVNGNFSEVADSVNDNDARITTLEVLDNDARIAALEALAESQFIVTIPFSAFSPSSSLVSLEEDLFTGYGWRSSNNGQSLWFAFAPLQVADKDGDVGLLRIVGVELEACDDSSTAELFLTLAACPAFEEDCANLPGYTIATGEADTRGCTILFNGPSDDEVHTLDNFSNTYRFILSDTTLENDAGLLRTRSVRVFLQPAELAPAE